MPTPPPRQCTCPLYLQEADHPDKQHHREVAAFLSALTRDQRRLFAALESNRLGWGGITHVAAMTGVRPEAIARGRRDLAGLVRGERLKKERKPVPGRPRTEQKYPGLAAALAEMLCDESAGSPTDDQKWVRSSARKLSARLKERGFAVGHNTVWCMLQRMGYSMRTGIRKRRGITRDPAARDEQFRYIAAQKQAFADAGVPVVSVDTKKKELIGNFRRPGRSWCKDAPQVETYDFASQAEGVATPFGVYDVGRNTGYVVVGLSHSTPEFTATAIARWWQEEGRVAHPGASRLMILADGGGGNGSRVRAWKWNLQVKLYDRFGLTVTVCHYPPGCSKWNPVEYRLFSQISMNWEGKPLCSLAVILGFIRGKDRNLLNHPSLARPWTAICSHVFAPHRTAHRAMVRMSISSRRRFRSIRGSGTSANASVIERGIGILPGIPMS